MKASGLEKVIASALDIEPKTVGTYMRWLKAEGLIRTGGRGTGAPDMDWQDAARAVLAILVTNRPGQAVQAVRDFGCLPQVYGEGGPIARDAGLEGGLASVFAFYGRKPALYVELGGRDRDGDLLAPEGSISVHVSDVHVSIAIGGRRYSFQPELRSIHADPDPRFDRYRQRIQVIRTIGQAEISEIALAVAEAT